MTRSIKSCLATLAFALLPLVSALPAQDQESESIDRAPKVSAEVTVENASENANKQVDKSPDLEPQVLADGPIHESFADVDRNHARPNVLIELSPPQPIKEVKPERLQGSSQPRKQGSETKSQARKAQWISGYWHWDTDKESFIWVSGVWRAPPPGQAWTEGYWEATDAGNRWVAGYWKAKTSPSDQFLPEPPISLDRGPRHPRPSDRHFYCPGNWEYVVSEASVVDSPTGGKYVWRPGRWHPRETDWTWIPVSYVWTPKGYVYSNGYWDYRIEDRGTAYLAVWFIYVNDWLNRDRYGQLIDITFRPRHRLDIDSFRRQQTADLQQQNLNVQSESFEPSSQQIRREEQREQTERNRKQFAREQERQRRQQELNQNLDREQRQQAQLARQQRMEVDRAREQRRQAAQATVQQSTEQLRLQNQREDRRRSQEQFMRTQERIKRRAEQSGSGNGR